MGTTKAGAQGEVSKSDAMAKPLGTGSWKQYCDGERGEEMVEAGTDTRWWINDSNMRGSRR
jgi:hypothetical protein